ncbi:MAG: hypothetical protein V1753_06850 [Pseudomonadota bacterium]
MEYQYITSQSGKTIAVVVPIHLWEAMQDMLEQDAISDQELHEAEQGWQEYLAGKGQPIEQVMQELLND